MTMNTTRWITHGLMIGTGFAAALAFSGKGTAQRGAEAITNEHGSYSKRTHARPAQIRPREMLRSLAAVPMESQERENLKSEIYSEWSTQDPLGFLAYFEHRPQSGYADIDAAFPILAKTQPEELLAYARRTGCEDAARKLVEYADPAVVLELLKQDGCERFPKGLLENLVKKGERLDPHFHEKLAEITDPEARKTALAEAASEIESAGRVEDFMLFLGQYPEVLAPDEAGRRVGKLLLMDRRELGRLDALEGEVRAAAVGEIIDSFDDEHVSEQGQREILAALAARGDLASRRMEVLEAIAEDADEVSPESATAWKGWALSLPAGEESRPLQLASMVRWAISTQAEVGDFASLPDGELRDGAVVGGVARYLSAENLPEARKMIALIGDSALRAKMEGYLTLMEKGEEPDDFDPFGFGEK